MTAVVAKTVLGSVSAKAAFDDEWIPLHAWSAWTVLSKLVCSARLYSQCGIDITESATAAVTFVEEDFGYDKE